MNLNFQQVWQDERGKAKREDTEAATEKNMTSFKEEGFNVNRRAMGYLQGSCYADKRNQVLVNFNGDVFKCTARDFKTEIRDGYLTTGGEVVWENDALERRMKAVLRNPVCHHCRIAPLCGGNCAQRNMENAGAERCFMGYDEAAKDMAVLNRFYDRFVDVPRHMEICTE